MANDILTNAVAKSAYDMRDYTIKARTDFPEAFRVFDDIPVKNQFTKPTCVAHALASLVEYHNKRQSGKYRRFSTEYIYGMRLDGYYIGDGMCIKDGLKTLKNYGDVYYIDLAGNSNFERAMMKVANDWDDLKAKAYPHRIGAYYKLNNTNEIKTALMRDGVVVASMNTYEGAKLDDYIYTYDKNAEHGRHCILIIGWNADGWLVQNSWGYFYGDSGRFYLPFDFEFNEAWGVTDDIHELKTPKRNKWLDILYKIVNAIVRRLQGAKM